MLKAILFDLDDTLIDWGHFSQNWEEIEGRHLPYVYDYMATLGSLSGDLQAYKKEYGVRVRDAWVNARETLIAPHLGRILVETAAAMGIPQEKVDLKVCLEQYQWTAVEGTTVFPDVIDGLKRLRDAGLRFGIVTNAFQPMWLRDREMEAHGLLEFFPECRFSAADVGFLKPHPNIFAAALECLGTSPEETVFIGDNPVADIAGAQAAGMRAILRVIQPAKPLISGLVIPDAAINSLHDLESVFDEWFPGWNAKA